MASQLLSATTFLALIPIAIYIMRRFLTPQSPPPAAETSFQAPESPLSKFLASALPNSVILPQHGAAFKQSMNFYWAAQECEVVPACFIKPRDAKELSTAVTLLKQEYDERRIAGKGEVRGLFAVRGGGHSPVAGAASTEVSTTNNGT